MHTSIQLMMLALVSGGGAHALVNEKAMTYEALRESKDMHELLHGYSTTSAADSFGTISDIRAAGPAKVLRDSTDANNVGLALKETTIDVADQTNIRSGNQNQKTTAAITTQPVTLTVGDTVNFRWRYGTGYGAKNGCEAGDAVNPTVSICLGESSSNKCDDRLWTDNIDKMKKDDNLYFPFDKQCKQWDKTSGEAPAKWQDFTGWSPYHSASFSVPASVTTGGEVTKNLYWYFEVETRNVHVSSKDWIISKKEE